jgi:outer membrane protein assembly factor BamD (BamD/ComL family)
MTGCTMDMFDLRPLPKMAEPPENYTLGSNGLESAPKKELTEADKLLYGAHKLLDDGQFEDAERVFHRIADNKKNATNVAEEARFYEAECLFQRKKYPDACDTYHRMLKDFEHTRYKQQALARMFTIANYWLDDMRTKMKEAKEKKSNPWFAEPDWLHPFDETKPLLDEKGRALEALQNICLADYKGPYSDKALFLMGAVEFYDEDWKEADHNFTLLLEQHPESPFVQNALSMAVIAKNMATGGADYDGRKAAEARKLVDTLLNQYRDKLDAKESEKLLSLKGTITYQQAEKDYNTAEFYRRTGKMAPAYFCYEIVRRRYSGSDFAAKAEKRMYEIRDQVDKEAGKNLPPIDAPKGSAKPVPVGPQPTPLAPLPPAQTPELLPAPRVLPPPQPSGQ